MSGGIHTSGFNGQHQISEHPAGVGVGLVQREPGHRLTISCELRHERKSRLAEVRVCRSWRQCGPRRARAGQSAICSASQAIRDHVQTSPADRWPIVAAKLAKLNEGRPSVTASLTQLASSMSPTSSKCHAVQRARAVMDDGAPLIAAVERDELAVSAAAVTQRLNQSQWRQSPRPVKCWAPAQQASHSCRSHACSRGSSLAPGG